MSLYKQTVKIKDRVKAILLEKPEMRDNDYRLLAVLWMREVGAERINQMTAFELLKHLAIGKLSHPESVRRIRAKLQEEHIELRGAKYKQRQQDGDDFTQSIVGDGGLKP